MKMVGAPCEELLAEKRPGSGEEQIAYPVLPRVRFEERVRLGVSRSREVRNLGFNVNGKYKLLGLFSGYAVRNAVNKIRKRDQGPQRERFV